MFNMVCWWLWGLFGRPFGRHIYSQFHYIARQYAFVPKYNRTTKGN